MHGYDGELSLYGEVCPEGSDGKCYAGEGDLDFAEQICCNSNVRAVEELSCHCEIELDFPGCYFSDGENYEYYNDPK